MAKTEENWRPGTDYADSGVSLRSETIFERVAVFVDIPNLWATAKEFGYKFDPAPLMEAAKMRGRVVLAKAYSTVQWGKPVNPGVADVEQAGFEAVSRFVSPNDGHGKKDIDSLLATEMIVAAYEDIADVFALASGDSDFVPVLRTIRRLGKRVVVMAHPFLVPSRLLAVSDEFVSVVPAEGGESTRFSGDSEGVHSGKSARLSIDGLPRSLSDSGCSGFREESKGGKNGNAW